MNYLLIVMTKEVPVVFQICLLSPFTNVRDSVEKTDEEEEITTLTKLLIIKPSEDILNLCGKMLFL